MQASAHFFISSKHDQFPHRCNFFLILFAFNFTPRHTSSAVRIVRTFHCDLRSIINTGASRKRKKDCKLLLLSALSGQVLSIVTQETGTMMTSAQTGSVITAATPAFMVVFGYVLLHEKLTAGRIISVVLATIGVLFIVLDPDNFEINPLGGLSLFVAAVTWAFMSVLLKFLSEYPVITVTFYSVLIAFLTLTPYGLYWLLTSADYAAMSAPSVWGSVLYLGFISTTAGFCLWNKGLLYMDASLGGLFMFFQPTVGTFLGWLLLAEPVTLYFWIGFTLIAVGVVLALRGGNTTAAEKLARCHQDSGKDSHPGGA